MPISIETFVVFFDGLSLSVDFFESIYSVVWTFCGDFWVRVRSSDNLFNTPLTCPKSNSKVPTDIGIVNKVNT